MQRELNITATITTNMHQFPFKIPKSLYSYAELFEDAPFKTIKRLKKQLRKRGPDAVGYFLLAWFYHLLDDNQNAIREALRAKTYAAGSPLMEHLHYFLVHPEVFEATVPAQIYATGKTFIQGTRKSPLLDLDALISMLEEVESQRIRIPSKDEPYNDVDLSEDAGNVDDIASETLAKIHILQGNRAEAIAVYQKLIQLHPEKATAYNAQIKSIEESDD